MPNHDNGDAAARREADACAAEEALRAEVRAVAAALKAEHMMADCVQRPHHLTNEDLELAARTPPVIESTDAAQAAFREKLAYWRSNGAPAYHGPRAGRDT